MYAKLLYTERQYITTTQRIFISLRQRKEAGRSAKYAFPEICDLTTGAQTSFKKRKKKCGPVKWLIE